MENKTEENFQIIRDHRNKAVVVIWHLCKLVTTRYARICYSYKYNSYTCSSYRSCICTDICAYSNMLMLNVHMYKCFFFCVFLLSSFPFSTSIWLECKPYRTICGILYFSLVSHVNEKGEEIYSLSIIRLPI